MSKIIGIDLGTTNSCVAVIDNGEPLVVPNAEGSRTTPSIIAFGSDGDRLVGQIAKRQAVTNPENTLYAIKRLIGRKFDDPEVRSFRESSPFKIVGADNGDCRMQIDGRDYSAPELSAIVLDKMRKVAEEYLGDQISRAVITVPAYFNDAQRQATKDAGRIAGLDVLRIINEPTAAALAYGVDTGTQGIIAVFDLGGGTFDVSILDIADGVFEVRSTHGDTFLGGEDFDHRIIDHCLGTFEQETGINLRSDPMAMQRLKEAAEKAKHELSSTLEAEVSLPFVTVDEAKGPQHLNVTISRAQLEDLVGDLIDRLEAPCREALRAAGIPASKVSQVLLVGGMTRMPRVQAKVEEIFGKPPNRELNPDEVVAVGAAVQGSVLAGETKDVLLLDVLPLDIGIETAGGIFTRLIERNTTIPCKKTQEFTTAQDNQPMVSVHVLQGMREMADDNKSLARFELHGIPPAPRGVPKIEVTFEVDANGIMSVTARDAGTNIQQQVRIMPSSGLNEAEIQRMVSEASLFGAQDAMRREVAEARNTLEGLIYTTRSSLEHYGDALSFEDLMSIREELARAEDSSKSSDMQELNSARDSLSRSAQLLAEVIYQAAAAQADAMGADDPDEDPLDLPDFE